MGVVPQSLKIEHKYGLISLQVSGEFASEWEIRSRFLSMKKKTFLEISVRELTNNGKENGRKFSEIV